MRLHSIGSMSIVAAAVASLALIPAAAQTPASPRASDVPRAGDGKRAEHTSITGQRPMVGRPIIDPPDGKIPYQPWAAKFAAFLYAEHKHPSKPEYLDPVSRGFLDGVPRINYQGGFQIHQFPGTVVITHEYHHTYPAAGGRRAVGKRGLGG